MIQFLEINAMHLMDCLINLFIQTIYIHKTKRFSSKKHDFFTSSYKLNGRKLFFC